MKYSDFAREERYYCNHLYRILCQGKDNDDQNSGLGGILSYIFEITKTNLEITRAEIANAEIYTEVAIFRDYYRYLKNQIQDRNNFLSEIFYALKNYPSLPDVINMEKVTEMSDYLIEKPGVHPKDYSWNLLDEYNKEDKQFYSIYSSLFSAKPDFLMIYDQLMIWIEAKVCLSFDRKQINRTRLIADLCSSDVFRDVFNNRENLVIKLGTNRHRKMKTEGDFISWNKLHEIAIKIMPDHKQDYSVKAIGNIDNVL